jgi:hypothetical protein
VKLGRNPDDDGTLGFSAARIFEGFLEQTASTGAPVPRSNDGNRRGFDDPLMPP